MILAKFYYLKLVHIHIFIYLLFFKIMCKEDALNENISYYEILQLLIYTIRIYLND